MIRCGIDLFHETKTFFRKPSLSALALQSPNDRIIVPVIMHVVGNSSIQNLVTESRINAQIKQLNQDFSMTNNKDFSRTNPEFVGIPGPFEPWKATSAVISFELKQIVRKNTEFEFCPAGIALPGCYVSDLCGDPIKRSTSNGSDAIDTDKNLNVWAVDLIGSGILGYAYFPWWRLEGQCYQETDGVVIDASTVGSISSPNPGVYFEETGNGYLNIGRTLTHEVGHYLGLAHIWNDCYPISPGIPNCCRSEEDLPAQDGPNFDRPIFPNRPNSCPGSTGSPAPQYGDMYMNYMDYSTDDTMCMFSESQIQTCIDSCISYRPNMIRKFNSASTSTLSLSGLSGVGNSDTYQCIVSTLDGKTVTSDMVTVQPMPKDVMAPENSLVGQMVGGVSFGGFVSINANGTVVAIGSYDWDYTVKVYVKNGSSSWIQRGSNLLAIDPSGIIKSACSGACGNQVAISDDGNVVAIGNNNSNKVRVYQWNGSSWVQRGSTLSQVNEDFGFSVALSGDGTVLAVGSPSGNGKVRVYIWSGSSWSQRGSTLVVSGTSSGFGTSVSLSVNGNILAAGAPWYTVGSLQTGLVRTYTWGGSTWNQLGGDILGKGTLGNFGMGLSLNSSGTVLAASSPFISPHYIDVMRLVLGSWVMVGRLEKVDGGYLSNSFFQFGFSVSLSGDGLMLAACSNGSFQQPEPGKYVKIYNVLPNELVEKKTFMGVGHSVSVSRNGNSIIVGNPEFGTPLPGTTDFPGRVKIFDSP